jgi:predicted enzyme related to lactoylglutathione lyase
MKLGYARLFVNDLPTAVRFYTEVLGLPLSWWDQEAGHAGIGTGECTLLLEASSGESPKFTGLSLVTDDIDGKHRELLDKAVEFSQAPARKEWGGMLAYFKDPEGNELGLVQLDAK